MAGSHGFPTPAELTDARRTADLVEVPPRLVLAISGAGAPDQPEFISSLGALYGITYGLKFGRKKAGGTDFKVGALVGIWRIEASAHAEGRTPPRESWRWTMQLDVPPDVAPDEIRNTVSAAVAKKGGKLQGNPYASKVLLVPEPARQYGRILHIGPYSEEPASFRTIEALLTSSRLRREPWHVEVYLSDPGRTAPDKLKTVLLAPIAGQ